VSETKNEGNERPDSATAAAPASAAGGGRRAMIEGSVWTTGVLLVVALVGIVNYLGMKYYQRFDWTASNLYSLSEKTSGVLGGLDRDIEVTLFIQPSSNVYEAAKELLERYAAATPRITLRVVDPQRNLVEAQRLVDEFELAQLSVVVFKAGTDKRVIEETTLADWDYSGMQMGAPPTMTGFKGEEAFTGAILELVEQRKPKVLFTTGHGERGLEDFDDGGLSRVRELLGKENLDLESWASLGQNEVPAGTDALVVAGPRVNFVQPELDAFSRYLDGGGRMLVLLDLELDSQGGVVSTGLEAWLKPRGVEVGSDLVVDPSSTLPFFGAETIFVRATGIHPIVESLSQADYPVIFALSRSVKAGPVPADLDARTLLQTTADGWGETDLANLRGVAKGESDTPGPVSVGVAVGRRAEEEKSPEEEEEELEEETAEPTAAVDAAPAATTDATKPAWRLVVFGDSDFATNGQLTNVGNPTLLSNAFNWLLERQKLLGIGPKKPEQVRLTLTPGELRAITWGTALGMPAIAVAAGVLVWRRRRR
jgi:ABC-type uncharacterized transport system involved in gliding motility auxiliary subunit